MVVEKIAHVTAASRSFLDFVLDHAQVRTNVCTVQKFEEGYTLLSRTVPDYNLIFVRHGEATWVVDDHPVPLKRGDLILVPPAVRHHAFGPAGPMTLGSLHVEVTLPGGQNVFDVVQPPLVRHVVEESRLSRYLDQVIEEWDRPERAQAMLTMPSWARLVVLEMLRYDAGQGTLRQREIDPLVAGVLEEMNHRLVWFILLNDLVEWSGFSL